MITYFPTLYPDEILYSLFARYYAKAGHLAYIYAAEDLYVKRTTRPDVEFLNELTNEVKNILTINMSMEDLVQKHTMFPYYGRFLKYERRKQAFDAIVSMQGNYHNSDYFAYDEIYRCSEMEIIHGYDSGEFKPSEQVTYNQFIKMLVSAMGYSQYVELYGVYPTGYACL